MTPGTWRTNRACERSASVSTRPAADRDAATAGARWSTRRKVVVSLLSVAVLVGLIVGGTYGYLWYRYQQISKVHIADEVAAASGAPFTILVIGSDSRVGNTGQAVTNFGSSSVVTGQRSDVVQLWRVSPDTKTIQTVSIPRDTVVSMLPPDNSQFGTYNRINAAYNSGANQLVKTITANFGIVINHVVQVDFSGFQDAVNALGGIYLDFPYPAKDSFSGLDITTPGCQLVTGFQALATARARHYEYYTDGYWHTDGTSDFGRIQRQDVFLRALIASAKSKVNPLTVNAFLSSIHEGVTIDDGFGFNQLIGLALDYRSFDPADLEGQTLPTEAANDFGDLGDVLTVDQPAAQQMLVDIFGSSLVSPTNPPPNANGVPEPPPTVTTTTSRPPRPRARPRRPRRRPPRRPRHPRSTRFPARRVEPAPAGRATLRKRSQPPRRDPGPARSNSRWRT